VAAISAATALAALGYASMALLERRLALVSERRTALEDHRGVQPPLEARRMRRVVHAHRLGPDDLVAEMDRKGVDLAVICPLGQDPDNEYIAESMQAHPPGWSGSCEANPRDPLAPDIIRHAVTTLGLKGYKLHPQMQGHTPSSHALMDPVMQACADLGIPVYAHCLDDMWVTPYQYEEMIRPFPSVPLILGHMGFMWLGEEAMLGGGAASMSSRNVIHVAFEPARCDLSALARSGCSWVLTGPTNDFDLQIEMTAALPARRKGSTWSPAAICALCEADVSDRSIHCAARLRGPRGIQRPIDRLARPAGADAVGDGR